MNKLKDRLDKIDHLKTDVFPDGNPFFPHSTSVKEALTAIHTDLMELAKDKDVPGTPIEMAVAIIVNTELAELRKKIDEYCK